MIDLKDILEVRPHVQEALDAGDPVVALESTIITHGLPRPANLETARGCEEIVREAGATPATIGIIRGKLIVGLEDAEIGRLANADEVVKTNLSNLGTALSRGGYGATSVSTTIHAAALAGLSVAATGGIGGVHRGFEQTMDISSDLTALTRTDIVLVSAGAKSILDVAATREQLETRGVPVVGYKTDWFPLFYSPGQDIPVDGRFDEFGDIVQAYLTHRMLGIGSSMMVVANPPEEDAIPADLMNKIVARAVDDAKKEEIHGRGVTPFVLQRVKELTEGDSLRANLALIRNNCRIAAGIAVELSNQRKAAEA
ncbi:pseudouridine-5'-phosphate glycosidase [bacterium]|nr:pseudouridine-5'-phosphate glycosidase [bacterium]